MTNESYPADGSREDRRDEQACSADPSSLIAETFEDMKPHKNALLTILALCEEEQPASLIAERIEELQGRSAVFSPANLCRILEQAGALERLCVLEEDDECEYGTENAGGAGSQSAVAGKAESAAETDAASALCPASPNKPRLIPASDAPDRKAAESTEDGVSFVQARPQRESHWVTTDAGRAFLAAQDVQRSIDALSKEESEWWPIYLELFDYLADDAGHTQPDVARHITVLPSFIEVNDRLSTTHMLDRAQAVGAIVWKGGWKLTPEGRAHLEQAR